MFIYRKSADRNYAPEEIPPDERYTAEIIVAKHRNGPVGTVKLLFNANCTSFRNLEKNLSENKGPINEHRSAPALKPKSAFQNQPVSAEPPTPQF